MNAIQTENLTKLYGKHRGINNVTLTVPEGDFFGFIGPNGAGKSTTIRLCLGLIAPTSGSVRIFGKEVREDTTGILRQVGYLPSETAFYNGMRVRELLKLSADLRKMDCREEAERLCRALDLDPDRKIDQLSLGNRKKAGIVCALQHKPRLYILDEPTSGLDPLIQREFYRLLQERNKEGATVFLSSHVLSEVQRYCTHAAIIREGKLLTTGSVEELGHTGVKRVSLQGAQRVPALPGVRSGKVEGNTVSFLYSGEPGQLLSALAALPVTDVSIAEPDLEEVFLHYYNKEGEV